MGISYADVGHMLRCGLHSTAKEMEKWLKQTKKQQALNEAMEIQKDRCEVYWRCADTQLKLLHSPSP